MRVFSGLVTGAALALATAAAAEEATWERFPMLECTGQARFDCAPGELRCQLGTSTARWRIDFAGRLVTYLNTPVGNRLFTERILTVEHEDGVSGIPAQNTVFLQSGRVIAFTADRAGNQGIEMDATMVGVGTERDVNITRFVCRPATSAPGEQQGLGQKRAVARREG